VGFLRIRKHYSLIALLEDFAQLLLKVRIAVAVPRGVDVKFFVQYEQCNKNCQPGNDIDGDQPSVPRLPALCGVDFTPRRLYIGFAGNGFVKAGADGFGLRGMGYSFQG